MKLSFRGPAALGLYASLSFGTLFAQDVLPSQKILVITREYTKPGKDGRTHQLVEQEYPKTLRANKISAPYYAAVSMSGHPRTLFFRGYPTFAAWANGPQGGARNPAMESALDKTDAADADLLASKDYSVWTMRDDMSLDPGFRVGARMEELSQFVVRPGHMKEWEELAKLVVDGYKKGVPGAHWAMYEMAYGTGGGTFLVITTLKSAAELDAEEAQDKQFGAALGADGLKKLAELEAACVESRQTNLFKIDPKMSYPPEAMEKAEPQFWSGSQK